MFAHFAIFSIYLVGLIGWLAMLVIEDKVGPVGYCKVLRWETVFSALGMISMLTLISLFTYLSIKFSEPLEDYGEDFLLLFQA